MPSVSPVGMILGSNGALGKIITRYLKTQNYQLLTPDRNQFDALKDSPEKLSELMGSTSPNFVLNLIGLNRDQCQNSPVENVMKINSLFPQILAKYLEYKGIPCVHISTDCVFSGWNGPYDEACFADAEDIYGISKAAAETAPCMVLRGTFLGPALDRPEQSFFDWVCSQKGTQLEAFSNLPWNGITYLTLAKLIAYIDREGLYRPGLFHLSRTQGETRFDLLKEINETFDLEIQLVGSKAEKVRDRTLVKTWGQLDPVLDVSLKNQLEDLKEFLGSERNFI